MPNSHTEFSTFKTVYIRLCSYDLRCPNIVLLWSVIHPKTDYTMQGQGSGGNVLAALCSFFIPGLGQLLQGRLLIAIVQFVLAAVLWFILMGWIIHLWSIIDAARFNPNR